MHSKKGQALGSGWAGMLIVGILALVLVAILGSFGANITSEVGEDFPAGSVEANITAQGIEGIENITEKSDLIGLILVVSVLVTLLLVGVGSYFLKGM